MFRKLSLPLAMLVAAGTLSVFSGVGANALEPMRDEYLIRNTATGRYLTVANNAQSAGTPVVLYEADGVGNENSWTKVTVDGQTMLRTINGYALTVDSDGALCLGEYAEDNVYQYFTLTGEGKSVRLSAGGWALTPDYNVNGSAVRMTDSGSLSDWELIAVNQKNTYSMGDVNRDGVVDVFDLGLAKRFLLDSSKADMEQLALANVVASLQFDVADLVLLTKFLLGVEHLNNYEYVQYPTNTIFPEVENIPEPTEPEPSYEPTTEPLPPVTEPITEPDTEPTDPTELPTEPTEPVQQLTLADMPAEYKEAMEWVWTNRFVREGSTTRQNTIFDQIIAGKGTLNFVVRWQSYKTVTYEQRQQFETLASDCINAWNDYLKSYDGWPYDHIDVKVVGWAVIDKSVLLDLHDDEIVYDNLIEPYDSSGDTSNGYETIPDKLPSAPSELSRFDHFFDKSYEYPGGLDKRFDMYLWCTEGFPSIGGCGGDWGQRLSDTAYLNMLGGQNEHVLIHEIGHGFGITDFYGGEGELDGFPPGGFPGNGTSIMMAGSSVSITDFDGWMLRYIWSNIKDEDGRF